MFKIHRKEMMCDFDFVLAWENGRFVALKAPSPPR